MVDLTIHLPEGFLEGEERDGYYVTAEMKKVWAVELDLLSQLQRVCTKHHIDYWACGGTLLGCARHKGMIPWDDDIDIVVMREGYERLCAVAAEEFKPPYFFQTEQTDPTSARGHIQLRNSQTTGILRDEQFRGCKFNQGIFIDVFPYDAIADSDAEVAAQCRNMQHYRRRMQQIMALTWRYQPAREGWRRVVKSLIHDLAACPVGRQLFNYRRYYNRYEREAMRYKGAKTERVKDLMVYCNEPEALIFPRSFFNETVMLPFEMLQLPAPKRYAEMLTIQYGDWQKPVRGGSVHGGVLFDADRPYTHYLRDGR